MTEDIAELICGLGEVARKQAGIIDRLFLLLLQYAQLGELEGECREMEEAAEIMGKWED